MYLWSEIIQNFSEKSVGHTIGVLVIWHTNAGQAVWSESNKYEAQIRNDFFHNFSLSLTKVLSLIRIVWKTFLTWAWTGKHPRQHKNKGKTRFKTTYSLILKLR